MSRKVASGAAEHSLAEIARQDGDIRAFVSINPEALRSQARLLDQQGSTGGLYGRTIGVKDVIETVEYPTALGSGIYRGRRTHRDSTIVSMLRAQGALIVGKTATAEFAYLAPAATRNPLDPKRTPGGSSSGSAAAVAAGMIDFAIGTQTGGSTIRPAAYCGVVGFKPTFGFVGTNGVMPLSPSFDTIGLFASTAKSMAELWQGLGFEQRADSPRRREAPRVGLVPRHHLPQVSTEGWVALERFTARVISAGGTVAPVVPTPRWADLPAHHALVGSHEAFQSLHFEYTRYRANLSEVLAQYLQRGALASPYEVQCARQEISQARAECDEVFEAFDFIIAPSAEGLPPVGLTTTGDPSFCIPWTALGVPTVTIPTDDKPAGRLKLGIQLVGRMNRDSDLLAWAKWAESLMARAQ